MLLLSLAASMTGLRSAEAAANEHQFRIGDGYPVFATATVIQNGSGLIYFAPHSNETIAQQCGKDAVRQYGGKFVYLTHPGGERDITVNYEGKRYVFDPNRIFTDLGAAASLHNLSGIYPDHILKGVRTFAQQIVALIGEPPPGAPVVGLHNNTRSGPYSIDSYMPGGNFPQNASKVYVNREKNEHDLFFTTVPLYFDELKARGYNVALQSDKVTDDGSLSVYCAQKRIPYVNVDALNAPASRQEQMKMIDLVRSISLNQDALQGSTALLGSGR